MEKITFLSCDELFDNKLEIFEKRGTKAAITDFAILLGGYVSDDYYVSDKKDLANRTGYYWTKTDDNDYDARVVSRTGNRYHNNVRNRDVGSRPALEFSSIDSILANRVSRKAVDGIFEMNLGEYPQTAVDVSMQKRLEEKLRYGDFELKKIDKVITTDSRKYDDYDESFKELRHSIYEYAGRKFVRVIANSCFAGEEFKLSNGVSYKDGDPVWVEVEPVKLLIDEKSKMSIFEKIIFAGVQFNEKSDYVTENFDRTNIKRFMNEYFYPELLQFENLVYTDVDKYSEERVSRKTRLQLINPDETDISLRRRMTDTEIIHNWIEAGQSVLLRGPSGIGKTERIKNLYPDLIYIKLTNNIFPEKVVGSMNLQTGQNIPPSYAKEAILSCATDEEKKMITENIQNLYSLADTIYERNKNSDKKIVILLDELLNVKPAVQSLVYTLVLNKLVESGKGLKLPANTVIVATGNQKKYSSVAEDLAEPLEKRFDHILDMEPKVLEWVNEYAIPNNIHPSVVGYILSKYLSRGKSERLEDIGYFYEEPEVGEQNLDRFGCHGRTNDPRGWVSISNTLYAFEEDLKKSKFIGKDVESILRTSIGSKLRDEWASEFFSFYNVPTLSVQDVVSGNWTQADLPRDINERFACVMALLFADIDEVGVCREFIREHCDPEYLQIYDMCWVGNDPTKMEILSEIESVKESGGKSL